MDLYNKSKYKLLSVEQIFKNKKNKDLRLDFLESVIKLADKEEGLTQKEIEENPQDEKIMYEFISLEENQIKELEEEAVRKNNKIVSYYLNNAKKSNKSSYNSLQKSDVEDSEERFDEIQEEVFPILKETKKILLDGYIGSSVSIQSFLLLKSAQINPSK